MNRLMTFIVEQIYCRGKIGQVIANRIISKYDGGEYWSKTLRKIYENKYDIRVGYGTYGCFSTRFRPHVIIGNFCSIANDVDRLVGNHPYDMISTHPFFHLTRFGAISKDKYTENRLVIGHDVWIGTKATITGNVKSIGNGAIIGANAVVTKDVPPYAIVAGVPARVLGYRFDEKTRQRIEASRWYDLSVDKLRKIAEFADNIDLFIDKASDLFDEKEGDWEKNEKEK